MPLTADLDAPRIVGRPTVGDLRPGRLCHLGDALLGSAGEHDLVSGRV